VCCDELLLVHDGRVETFELSLDEYPQWLAGRGRRPDNDSPRDSVQSAPSRKQQKREQAEQRKRLQPLRNRVSSAEQALEAVQAEKLRMEQLLADSKLYDDSNKDRLRSLLLEKARLDGRCECLEQDWLEASEALEAMQASD
jgi:ATP-binding cassette subfamily F protein 3